MAQVSTSLMLDSDTTAKAKELFTDLGLDLSTAVNIFFRQALRENAIPFTISRDIPNEDTIEAMREADEFEKHPERYKRYSSFKELLNEVAADA